MQGPALRATGRNNMNKMLAAAGGLTAKRATPRKMETLLKIHGMFYFAERQDVSMQHPERWKHLSLKINGMFFLQSDRTSACNAQKDGNATF